MKRLALLLWLLLLAPCCADTFEGYCVSVHDGDTIHVERPDGTVERVRLAGVDCPELKQPHGKAAKKFVVQVCLDQPVRVTYQERDRYKRIVGDIYVEGAWVNADLLQAGLGWHYKEYDGRLSLSDKEAEAREAKRGIWKGKPVAPWEYRKREQERRKKEIGT